MGPPINSEQLFELATEIGPLWGSRSAPIETPTTLLFWLLNQCHVAQLSGVPVRCLLTTSFRAADRVARPWGKYAWMSTVGRFQSVRSSTSDPSSTSFRTVRIAVEQIPRPAIAATTAPSLSLTVMCGCRSTVTVSPSRSKVQPMSPLGPLMIQ